MDGPNTSWTIESLKAYFDQRFVDQQTAVQAALVAVQKQTADAMAAAEKAVIKAETSNEARFAGVNEFRATLADQQRMLMPRAEVEVIVKGLESTIAALKEQLGKHDSQRVAVTANAGGMKEGWGMAVGAVGIVIAIVVFLMKFTQ